MPDITVKLGDQVLQNRRFDGDLLRIGRSRENDIVLENLSVSRDHAQLRFHDGRYILTDLNSANGTLVNGVRITKTEIIDEDVITIGKHKIHFRNRVLDEAIASGEPHDVSKTVMVEPKAEAWLTVESGRLKDREFKLTRFETSLGKAPSNDVVITDDWLLAKKQAVILRKGNNSFEIEDLGGLRKVKINGKPIAEKSPLANGDTVELGGTKLTFRSTATPSIPTGRVPSELPIEPLRSPLERPALARVNGSAAPGLNGDESLDIEEGFKSVKITLRPESAPPEVAPPLHEPPAKSENPPEQISAENTPSLEVTPPTPLPATTPKENQSADVLPPAPSKTRNDQPNNDQPAEGARQKVFENETSTSRRRRKHHKRAAMKNETRGGGDSPVPAPAEASPVSPATATATATTGTPDEKEIKLWENALNNPSPAIKRQAARMLKKLTGKDYDV